MANVNKIYRSIREKDKIGHQRRYLKKVMPYMAELWYPAAIKDELPNSGSFYSMYPWRGLLHTTEGSSYAGARSVYVRNRSAPHFTCSFEQGRFSVRQHIPLNRAARALQNLGGGVETNRIRCIQIEIVGFAAQSGAFSHPYLDGIGNLMRWIERNTTIQRTAPIFYGTDAGFILASKSARQRMSFAEWNAFNGWCGHQHCPENDHWDPGKIDINYLLSVGGPTPTPPSGGNIVAVNSPPVKKVDDPQGRGYWIITNDGGVFTFSFEGKELPFHGSLGGILLSKPIIDAGSTTGNGYWMMGADGGIFAFGDEKYAGRVEHIG